MNVGIINTLVQLRDDLKLWVTNNLHKKADISYVDEKIADIPEFDPTELQEAISANKTEVDNALAGKSDNSHNHDSDYDTLGAAEAALGSAKDYADSIKNDLLNGAGEAYDTLKELGDLIDDNKDALGALEIVATGKADKNHGHAITDIANLQSTLDKKSEIDHRHDDIYYTEGEIDSKLGVIQAEINDKADKGIFEAYIESNNNVVSNHGTRLDAIESDYLKSTDKTELEGDISEVSGKADANERAIIVLNGDIAAEGSVQKTVNDVVNEFTEHQFAPLSAQVEELMVNLSDYKEEVSDQFADFDSAIQEDLNQKSDKGHDHDDLYYDKDETLGLITVEDIYNIVALIQDPGENIDPVTAATKYWVERYFQPKGDYLTEPDITAHNVSTSSHSDIRLLIENLSQDFYTFADCDDETLSQLQEVVNYIKNNASLIEGVTTSKVNVSDIVNNLTTNSDKRPLSAAQGVVLKALIDAITVPTKVSELENDSGYLVSYTETDPTVPAWAKTPNKPAYTASEVGAATAEHKHTVTVTGTNASSTVTGTVNVPTVSKTQKYMSASADIPVVTNTTTSVLGADTAFNVTGGTVSTTKLSAEASNVVVGASGTANAIIDFNDQSTATAIASLNTTTIKNPTVTSVSIPNVTQNDDVTASKVSATAGQAASWSASVSNGVLSFDWIANTPTEVSTTDVTASKVTLGTALSASSVSTDDVTVATGVNSTVDAIVSLGVPVTATTLTGVKVTTQPKITIVAGDSGDVTVATDVGTISVTAGGNNVDAVTGVNVAAPAITLINNDSRVDGAVPVVSSVEVGSVIENLQNGSAEAQTWTQGVVTVESINN